MTKLDKIIKKLAKDTIEQLDTLDVPQLRDLIVVCEQAIDQAKDELESNSAYQATKDNLKALRGGYSDTKKYQTAKIAYALYRLSENE